MARTPIYPDSEGVGRIPWREAERALARQSQDVVFSAIRPMIIVIPSPEFRSNAVAAALDTWPVANKALFTQFDLSEPRVLNNVLLAVTIAGNLDIRIYKVLPGGVTGSALNPSNAATPGTGNIRRGVLASTPGFPLPLTAGHYYLGMASDGTALKVFFEQGHTAVPAGGYVSAAMCGAKEQTTAYPLPDTATFADASGTTGFVCATLEFEP